jgi:hypothetical protein
MEVIEVAPRDYAESFEAITWERHIRRTEEIDNPVQQTLTGT